MDGPTIALPRSARLAAWATAWLAGGGAGSLDDVLAAVRGVDGPHRVAGLPGHEAPVGLAMALGAVRACGPPGLRLALPASGDPLGLPGPPALNALAVEAGEAVLVCGLPWALVPEVAAGDPAGDSGAAVTWHVHEAHDRPVDVPGLNEAEHDLACAVREAAGDLAVLDVAGATPATLQRLGSLRSARAPLLPVGHGPQAERLAAQALRMLAVVVLARRDDGAAVTGGHVLRRSAALAPLERAARRAVVAAVGAALETTR